MGHATVRATLDAVHRVTVLCHYAVPLCCATLLCCRPCPCCATLFYYAVLILCCAVLCVYCAVYVYPPCRRWWLVKESHGRPRARMGASYQCLPCRETKPKTMWSCMWRALPTLTKIRARGAKPIGAFGLVVVPLPFPTNQPFWLCLHSITLLPIITGRGVKYTHDINSHILRSDSGPTRIRLIPKASDQKEIVVGDGGA